MDRTGGRLGHPTTFTLCEGRREPQRLEDTKKGRGSKTNDSLSGVVWSSSGRSLRSPQRHSARSRAEVVLVRTATIVRGDARHRPKD